VALESQIEPGQILARFRNDSRIGPAVEALTAAFDQPVTKAG